MQMKLTPRDHHVLNVMKRQGYVALGTEHCGTGTAAKLEQLGMVDLHSFVDKSGAIRFCIIPKGSDPDRTTYVKEHRGEQGPMQEAQPRDIDDSDDERDHNPTKQPELSYMIRSVMQILQSALDKVETDATKH